MIDIYDFVIEKLTQKYIEQSMKDRNINKIECISKAEAYKELIKLMKEVKNYE